MIIFLPGEMGHNDLWHMVALWGQAEDKVFWKQMAMIQSHYSYSNKCNKQGIGCLVLMDLESTHREVDKLKKKIECMPNPASVKT